MYAFSFIEGNEYLSEERVQYIEDLVVLIHTV